MYKRDCAAINDWIGQDIHRLRHMMVFVLLSIRVPFHRVQQQYRDVLTHESDSDALWGFKRDAYLGLYSLSKRWLISDLLDRTNDTAEMLQFMTEELKGFGNAKAGFVLQMLGHDVACLDTHNLTKLGYTYADIRTMTAAEYVQLCRNTGGSEYWWNKWCEYIGMTSKHFLDGDKVSRYHYDVIRKAV